MRSLVAIAGLLLFALPQDPGRGAGSQGPPPQDPPPAARPPADAAPLAPVLDPAIRVERRDLLQRFVPPSPLEGLWELRRMAIGGHELAQVRGYIWFGSRHMMLHLMQASPAGDEPLIQSGVRRYQFDGRVLTTTALIGHDNHADDVLRFEIPGLVERRRVTVAGPRLRVESDDSGSFFEFTRIE